MPVLPKGTIAEWNVTLLTKFLEDWFRNHPIPAVTNLQVDNLKVMQSLDVVKSVSFDAINLHVIGSTGEPAFQNSWVIYGAPYSVAAYFKDALGWVHLTGVIKSGTVGSSAFTLPPGYRPAVNPGPYAVVSGGVFGRVDVAVNGTVTPQAPSVNTSVSLEGITFKAA